MTPHDPSALLAAQRERTCRGCGCTEDRACAGGCWWVEEDLCSACVEDTEDGADAAEGCVTCGTAGQLEHGVTCLSCGGRGFVALDRAGF